MPREDNDETGNVYTYQPIEKKENTLCGLGLFFGATTCVWGGNLILAAIGVILSTLGIIMVLCNWRTEKLLWAGVTGLILSVASGWHYYSMYFGSDTPINLF